MYWAWRAHHPPRPSCGYATVFHGGDLAATTPRPSSTGRPRDPQRSVTCSTSDCSANKQLKHIVYTFQFQDLITSLDDLIITLSDNLITSSGRCMTSKISRLCNMLCPTQIMGEWFQILTHLTLKNASRSLLAKSWHNYIAYNRSMSDNCTSNTILIIANSILNNYVPLFIIDKNWTHRMYNVDQWEWPSFTSADSSHCWSTPWIFTYMPGTVRTYIV